MVAGRGEVARSAVAVFVAKRCVCPDKRGEHECALSDLLVWFRFYYVELIRVVLICKLEFKRCLFLRRNYKSQRERGSLSTNFVELANEGHGEHQASHEAGDGAHCGRE